MSDAGLSSSRPRAAVQAAVRSSWIRRPVLAPEPKLCLLTLSCAGGVPLMLDVEPTLDGLEIWPVQLPGHGARLTEKALETMPEVVAAIEANVLPAIEVPLVILGHSMGALVGLELARAVERRGRHELVQLIVAGCRPPHLKVDDPARHLLDIAALLAELERLEGTPPQVLANPELTRLIEPTVRTDLKICWDYAPGTGARLRCPIAAWGGSRDSEATEAQLDEWAHYTSGVRRTYVFAGSHFFVTENAAVSTLLSSELARHLTECGRRAS